MVDESIEWIEKVFKIEQQLNKVGAIKIKSGENSFHG
jgi:hypothetical protein